MKTLKLNEKEYKFPSPFDDPQFLMDFTRVANSRIAKPLDLLLAHIKDIPPEDRKELIKVALAEERKPLDWESPELKHYITTPEGTMEYLLLLWTRHQPGLTFEQVWELHRQAAKEHGELYMYSEADMEQAKKVLGQDYKS